MGVEVPVGLLSRLGKKLRILPSEPPPRPTMSRGAAPEPEEEEPASPRAAGQPVEVFIRDAVTTHPVVLFMKGTPDAPRCGFSAAAAGILRGYKVPLYTVDVLSDEDIRDGVKSFSNWPTIPQVFVGGEFVGGSDILTQLHESGELKPMIEKATGA